MSHKRLYHLFNLLFHVQVKDAVIYDEMLQTCMQDKIRGWMIDIRAHLLLLIRLHAVLWAEIIFKKCSF